MATPVAGRLSLRFGEPDEQSQPAKGLVYEARAGAAVVAPYDGRILFAGPFRGYGLILIIEHGEDIIPSCPVWGELTAASGNGFWPVNRLGP